MQDLADEAGLSRAEIHRAESGEVVSVDAYCRIAVALRLRPEFDLVDVKKRDRSTRLEDPVHSAMGELEAEHLSRLGLRVGLDEPYQHHQFAGRADLIAWDVERRVLLHLENRTRYPNVQEAIGSWNQKREYLAPELARRFGLAGWASVTHVMVGLWSAEVLHVLRIRSATFAAVAPDGPEAFESWWRGQPPTRGITSGLVVLDPLAQGRQQLYIGRDGIAIARPRHHGYADVAAKLSRVWTTF